MLLSVLLAFYVKHSTTSVSYPPPLCNTVDPRYIKLVYVELLPISSCCNIPLGILCKSIALYYMCTRLPFTATFDISNNVPRCAPASALFLKGERSLNSRTVGNILCRWIQNGTVLANAAAQDIESEGQFMPLEEKWPGWVSQFCSLRIWMAHANCGRSLSARADRHSASRMRKVSRSDMPSTRNRDGTQYFPRHGMPNWSCLCRWICLNVCQGFPWMAF